MSETSVRFRQPIVRRIAVVAALALLAEGCATSPQNRLYRPAGADLQRVLLLPLNVVIAMPGELTSGAKRVDQALHGYLAERGKSIETLGLAEARKAWLASAMECKAVGRGCRGFDGAARVLARHLRENREYELLIVPYLLLRPARMRLNNVAWDGVERRIERIGESNDGGFELDSGSIEAPSLAVFAFSSDGDKLFQGVGGLDLAHRLVFPPKRGSQALRWTFELRDDLFSDPALLREGVAVALDPLLPRSDVATQ